MPLEKLYGVPLTLTSLPEPGLIDARVHSRQLKQSFHGAK